MIPVLTEVTIHKTLQTIDTQSEEKGIDSDD